MNDLPENMTDHDAGNGLVVRLPSRWNPDKVARAIRWYRLEAQCVASGFNLFDRRGPR